MRHLFTVEDVFQLASSRCVVVPGVPYGFAVLVRQGASLILKAPDGTRRSAKLVGFEMISRGKPTGHAPFSIGGVTKAEIPIGTEVYLDEPDEPPWRLVGTVAAGELLLINGVNPWGKHWEPLAEGSSLLPTSEAAPSAQVRAYEAAIPGRRIQFAAAEVSPGVWEFYAGA